jgi:signal transduction histidine kinase
LAERIRPRGPEGASGWLESACKLIITFRAGVLLVTLLSLSQVEQRTLVIAAICVAGIASFVPLRFWDRVGPALVRSPAYLAAELVLAALILVLTGVQSPFFYFTLGTALLGGLVYGWAGAAVFSAMLVGVYAWVLTLDAPGRDPVPDSFQTYVGLPALYVLVAAAGAAARGLLDRQAEAEAGLAEQEARAAAEHERARLARDMHDSLAKTVHGIGFAALALAHRIERDPAAAAREARQLAADAKQAAEEARDLIAGLRGGDEEGRGDVAPLHVAARAECERWAATGGAELHAAIEPVDLVAPEAARELVWLLREALRNVSSHAPDATRVDVRLRALGGRAVLTIADDGPGFEVPDDLVELEAARHYGLVGMRERARVAGGDLDVESEPGEGTVLSAWVPAGAPAEAPAPASTSAPAPEPERSVAGYTWQ